MDRCGVIALDSFSLLRLTEVAVGGWVNRREMFVFGGRGREGAPETAGLCSGGSWCLKREIEEILLSLLPATLAGDLTGDLTGDLGEPPKMMLGLRVVLRTGLISSSSLLSLSTGSLSTCSLPTYIQASGSVSRDSIMTTSDGPPAS